MNDPHIALARLKEIIAETGREGLSLSERCALYAGARLLVADLDEHIEEYMDGHGYALEKSGYVVWHIGAALGFDVTNGHGADQHRSFAYGSLSSLEDQFPKM